MKGEAKMMNQEATKPLMGKAALLARIQGAYESVHRILEEGEDQALLEAVGSGGWTLKDSLAHLAAWEMVLLEFHLGGESFAAVTGYEGAVYRVTSYDEINAHLQARYRGMAPADVRDFVKDTHARLMAALEALPEDQLRQPHPVLSVGEASGLNWIDYIAANTYEHVEEHLAELR
jgi:hypothetical protein